MLATLRRQQDRAMIPRLIPTDDRIQVGNKTGTDEEKHALKDGAKRHVRADAAIVTGPDFNYVDRDLRAAGRGHAVGRRQRGADDRRAHVADDLRLLFSTRR